MSKFSKPDSSSTSSSDSAPCSPGAFVIKQHETQMSEPGPSVPNTFEAKAARRPRNLSLDKKAIERSHEQVSRPHVNTPIMKQPKWPILPGQQTVDPLGVNLQRIHDVLSHGDAFAQRHKELDLAHSLRIPSRNETPLPDIREMSLPSLEVEVSSDMDRISYERPRVFMRQYGVSMDDISPFSSVKPQCWNRARGLCALNGNIWEWMVAKAKKVFYWVPFVKDPATDDNPLAEIIEPWTLDKEGRFQLKRISTDETFDNLKETEVFTYLDENKGFLYDYLMTRVPFDAMERLYISKIEREFSGNSDEQCDTQDKTGTGHPDFVTYLEALKEEPLEYDMVLKLAENITLALKGQAYRLYKTQQEFIEVFTVDDTGVLPEPLVLKQQDPGVHILEAIRRKSCMYFTRVFDSVKLQDPSRTLIKIDHHDTRELPHMLAVPILTNNGEVSYVIEIWSTTTFQQKDSDLAANFVVWGSLAKHFFNMMLVKKKEGEVTDILLETVKGIFEEMVSLDQVIKRILHFAQSLVDADRASLFMVDNKNQELVSTVFDLKLYGQDSQEQFRIPINRGIAGHVATTGESVNITNAYDDERFNREVDELTGYRTVSILCMPVKVMGRAIGVVQMVNKRNATKFDCDDEKSFKQFATFFGLALHHAQLYGQITRKEQKYRVALEVLSYHNTCRDSEVVELASLAPHRLNFPLKDFYLDPFELSTLQKCQAAIIMFDDLFNMKNFESTCLTRFILSVKKNYRDVPYHNFHHGWSVAQTMYSILKNDTSKHFTLIQRLALFTASLCHDLDHRGYTNKYMSETASPLAAMYTTSTLEHHHFNITVTILQQDGHNIFGRFSSEEYKEVLGLIKTCILATDLVSFFPKLAELQVLCDTEKPSFEWGNMHHSELAMAISMTAADLSASAKPWKVQNETVKVIFMEFHKQGDKERAAGREPIPMMDRNKPEEQPASQVGFLTQICLPCYRILNKLLPNTQELLKMASLNLEIWAKKAAEVERQRNETKRMLEEDLTSLI